MGLTALLMYGAFIALAAFPLLRKNMSPDAFFVNDRVAGPFGVALSILVSCIGASSTIGVIGLAFTAGIPAMWWAGAGVLGLLAGSLLAGKVRATGVYTMPQLVETFLGPPCRPLVSAIIVLAWTSILAAQFSALGRLITTLTGLQPHLSLMTGVLLVAGHTLGGQAAVMKIDRLQTLILITGLTGMVLYLTLNNPGWMRELTFEWTNEEMRPGRIAYYVCILGGSYLVCPMLFSRFLSARSARAARRGAVLAAAALFVCSLLVVAAGLACRGFIPLGTPGDGVLAAVLSLFPEWGSLLILICLVSAVVSSADSCLLTASTVLCHDLLRRDDRRTCRATVISLALAGALVTRLDRDILGFLLMANDIYVSGVVIPVLIGIVIHGKRRIAPRVAFSAVMTGGTLGGIAAVTEIEAFSYAGMLFSACLMAAGGALHDNRTLCAREG